MKIRATNDVMIFYVWVSFVAQVFNQPTSEDKQQKKKKRMKNEKLRKIDKNTKHKQMKCTFSTFMNHLILIFKQPFETGY